MYSLNTNIQAFKNFNNNPEFSLLTVDHSLARSPVHENQTSFPIQKTIVPAVVSTSAKVPRRRRMAGTDMSMPSMSSSSAYTGSFLPSPAPAPAPDLACFDLSLRSLANRLSCAFTCTDPLTGSKGWSIARVVSSPRTACTFMPQTNASRRHCWADSSSPNAALQHAMLYKQAARVVIAFFFTSALEGEGDTMTASKPNCSQLSITC
mmetsp:Transcript_8378/g.21596  ORF Transcript_8378/g.21596 Transcript_8378/m.21596 type:complete len:207 (-) Transcript_8378:296-916(-)